MARKKTKNKRIRRKSNLDRERSWNCAMTGRRPRKSGTPRWEELPRIDGEPITTSN